METRVIALLMLIAMLAGCGTGGSGETAGPLGSATVQTAAEPPTETYSKVAAPHSVAKSAVAVTRTVTVSGGIVSGTYAASGTFAVGSTVYLKANTPPSGQSFVKWTGPVAFANASATATAFVMPNADVAITANWSTPPAPKPVATVPFPVTTHPRLWITVEDLPRLRSWAVPSNPVYKMRLQPLLATAVTRYNTQFFPKGVANPTWPDPGDIMGYTGLVTEQNALVFAFHSLIDPDPAARIQHAQRARNLIMVAMNEAAKGPLLNAPFRDPKFSVNNRANSCSEAWPLVVDWIYSATDASGNPILSAQDKATIRTVFLRWASECTNAGTSGGDRPSPIGTSNSTALLPGGNAYRICANNYYVGHARLLTLVALSFDPADDPPLNPALPAATMGNSLRSYIPLATGAWLYQQYAMFGEPDQVRADLGLAPSAKVGVASGGLPPEGMLYGASYAYLFGQLLALKTAGFADPAISGPQVALINGAPVWDRFVRGILTSMTPSAKVFPGQSWLGPVFQMARYGDVLRLWITPDYMRSFALLALIDQKNGVSTKLNAARWMAINGVEGGPAGLYSRIANPWAWGAQSAVLYFLLLDPNLPAPTDPRTGYSTAFYDASQGRLVEHSAWSPDASMLSFRCSWISLQHQQADGNKLEFHRKGEWLTKGVANYDNNYLGLTTDMNNTLSIKNFSANGTPKIGWWEAPAWAVGSQWQLGLCAGDPTATVSTQSNYTYCYGDATNLYNKPSIALTDVQHASRSVLWLKPDHVIVYDRATSKTPGMTKRFNLALTSVPLINGTLITSNTPSGQHLYLRSVLPEGAKISGAAIGTTVKPIAQLDPSTHRLLIEDSGTDARFLTVLEGADPAKSVPTAVGLIRNSSGTAFEGAQVGDAVALFKRTPAAAFGGTVYSVPDTVKRHYVSGLRPPAAIRCRSTRAARCSR